VSQTLGGRVDFVGRRTDAHSRTVRQPDPCQ
jgi:hypothetical protein